MFASLNPEDRKDVIEAAANKMNVDPIIIEKDWWVVQTLNALFFSPYAEHLTFKGGTSLSKAYQLIERFSEDVDITINKNHLSPDFDINVFETLSRKKRDTLLEALRSKASSFIIDTVVPHLQNSMPFSPIFKISDTDPLAVEIYYESVLSSKLSYIQSRIYIEFGFRGSINPAEQRPVQSYIQDTLGGAIDPNISLITTLSPIKTFFEKATLLHAEYNRPKDKQMPSRLSRHYYDLFQMYEAGLFQNALSSYEILYEVIKHKNALFSSGWVNYLSILDNGIKMSPHEDYVSALQKDYEETKIMIFQTPPNFDEIIAAIGLMEKIINLRIMLEKSSILSTE